MKKIISVIAPFFECLLILWLPILLIEETFLFNYVDSSFSLLCSLILSIICLIVYIINYKKIDKNKINCYIYNIANAILLVISNCGLGYLFLELVDSKIFNYCKGSGWDCFLDGIEYILIGVEYAFFTIVILIIWLLVRLIKFIISKIKNK